MRDSKEGKRETGKQSKADCRGTSEAFSEVRGKKVENYSHFDGTKPTIRVTGLN